MSKILIPPIEGQFYAKVEDFGAHYDNGGTLTTKIEDANVITSLVTGTLLKPRHKIVLDIDLPAVLLPSSTEGHFHLFIDKEIEQDAWLALIQALSNAGIIEEGYADASRNQGRSAVRLPWIKKEPIA